MSLMSSQGGSKGAMELKDSRELAGPTLTERFNSREEMLFAGRGALTRERDTALLTISPNPFDIPVEWGDAGMW